MALLFIDGFDHISGVDTMLTKWSRNNPSPNYVESGGMFGQGCIRFLGTSIEFIGKTFSGASSITVGFANKESEGWGYSITRCFIQTGANNNQVVLSRTGQGIWSFNNTAGGVLATASLTDHMETWNYIEVHVGISTNTGASDLQMMMNGKLWIDGGPGLDTDPIGTTSCHHVIFGANDQFTNNNWFIDDVYILDSAGPLSTFLGPIRIDTLWPTSEGTDGTDFTPTVGASAALDVDERSPNADTDYIHASAKDDFMTFSLSVWSAIQMDSIHGVALNLHARREGPAPRRIGGVIEASGVSFTSLSYTIPLEYQNFQTIYTSNPSDAGDAVWAVSEVCAVSVGVVLTL